MSTKNLGLVKSIFRQSTAPVRTDVLWYDTTNEVLRCYDVVNLNWVPINLYLSGEITDGVPTNTELSTIAGMTAIEAGSGFHFIVKATNDSELLYLVESDGSDWFYVTMTKAL